MLVRAVRCTYTCQINVNSESLSTGDLKAHFLTKYSKSTLIYDVIKNMATKIPFPYEFKKVTEEEDKIVKKYYKDYTRPFIRVGPHGYISMAGYGDHAADIYNLEVRPDDVWVIAFSRSGTTWLQELVWLVANDLDYNSASATPLSKRYAYIEYPTMAAETKKQEPPPGKPHHRATFDDFRNVHTLPSPRFIKTHLPLSLLPPKLLDTAKVLYAARDPRDVAVSFHFMHKLFRYFDEGVEFKEFWDLFKRDLIMHTPIFPHIKEFWNVRDHPNLTFLFYEEMLMNLRSVIDKVAVFLGKTYTDDQKDKLAEHLTFENMKKSAGFKINKSDDKDSELKFMRKGKSGNWVNYFNTPEMRKEAEEYFENNLKDTDLKFPEVNN